MSMVQRWLDVLIAGSMILILLPFVLPLILILRITGEGEIFYGQVRVGLDGRLFTLLKFATMLRNSPNIGAGEITLRNDPRVLPIGRVLRKSKLNELPQLWNVLVGDISIVGPRPMVPGTYAHYPLAAKRELDTVRPGLTGVGSLVFRDEERWLVSRTDSHIFYRDVIIPYKASLEQWYVRNRSLKLYAQIIFLTAIAIIVPASTLPWRVWPSLPPLPQSLRTNL